MAFDPVAARKEIDALTRACDRAEALYTGFEREGGIYVTLCIDRVSQGRTVAFGPDGLGPDGDVLWAGQHETVALFRLSELREVIAICERQYAKALGRIAEAKPG